MSLLDAYGGLMESVTLRAKVGINEYNESEYVNSTIDVIFYEDSKMIQNMAGEQLLQLAYIQTKAHIQIDDIIIKDGYSWPVIGIMITPTFEGEQYRIGNLGQRMI